jgi:acyl-[acyl carrier protein]--UDP-N-acetylglucosamine O-acyltransferase
MTNATVDTVVTGVEGQVLTVKYKDGEQKIIIGSDAIIRAYVVGSRDDLKLGANIAINNAVKKSDGTLEAARINVGRGGVVPQ